MLSNNMYSSNKQLPIEVPPEQAHLVQLDSSTSVFIALNAKQPVNELLLVKKFTDEKKNPDISVMMLHLSNWNKSTAEHLILMSHDVNSMIENYAMNFTNTADLWLCKP